MGAARRACPCTNKLTQNIHTNNHTYKPVETMKDTEDTESKWKEKHDATFSIVYVNNSSNNEQPYKPIIIITHSFYLTDF